MLPLPVTDPYPTTRGFSFTAACWVSSLALRCVPSRPCRPLTFSPLPAIPNQLLIVCLVVSVLHAAAATAAAVSSSGGSIGGLLGIGGGGGVLSLLGGGGIVRTTKTGHEFCPSRKTRPGEEEGTDDRRAVPVGDCTPTSG